MLRSWRQTAEEHKKRLDALTLVVAAVIAALDLTPATDHAAQQSMLATHDARDLAKAERELYPPLHVMLRERYPVIPRRRVKGTASR